jgi:hypothetical protein
MAEKNFFQDKWLKDQFNERNSGQRNDPAMEKKSPKPEMPSPNPDDVLRTMLNTPPQPHQPLTAKRKKAQPKKK